MNVVIYTTPTCGYCHQAKRFLNERGIPFAEYDVSRDRAAAQKMVDLTGQMGVPVITVDGEVVIGFDRPRLEQLLRGGGRAQPVRLGLQVADAAGRTDTPGAYVGGVAAGSLGEQAGLREGDVIVSIDSDRIASAADLQDILGQLRAGTRAVIVYIRGERAMQAQLAL